MRALWEKVPILLISVFCCSQYILAAESPSSTLPDAPSAVVSRGIDDPPDSAGSKTSSSPRDDEIRGSAGHWVKRVLRDQADIYTAPFHQSALKWDVGLPLVTIGLVAIDKHVSGEVPKSPGPVSTDISNGGLWGMEGVTGLIALDGVLTHNSHAEETGVLDAESFVGSAGLYAVVQLITGRDRPFQDERKGHFFQHTSIYGNSFPSGHAMFSWDTATILAHEYPKGWVKFLAYGTATAVSVTRITSGQHFPADVVAGGALGYLVARHIFHAHCKPGLSEACEAK
jgi:membrane-associated phospholipid phosphatase